MHRLEPSKYHLALPLFSALQEYQVAVAAVLAGTSPGQVWLDDHPNPHAAFLIGPEGCYLSGNPHAEGVYSGLRQVIPLGAYLYCDPLEWQAHFEQIWENRFARRHDRLHYLFDRPRMPDFSDRIPPGFELVPIEPGLLERELVNRYALISWIEEWHSQQDFFEHGFGFCLLQGDTIASWSLADWAVGDRCEIGITTAPPYRRQGLAALAASAAAQHAMERGFREIGWHCLRSNAGSIAVAHKVGFVLEREYTAFSSFLPAENPGDLTLAELADWALHYEHAAAERPAYAYQAAAAWALAGDLPRCLVDLRQAHESGAGFIPEWVEEDWRFAAMLEQPQLRAFLSELHRQS
jgi:RimJ/RimL family protein N-acetyltransferase